MRQKGLVVHTDYQFEVNEASTHAYVTIAVNSRGQVGILTNHADVGQLHSALQVLDPTEIKTKGFTLWWRAEGGHLVNAGNVYPEVPGFLHPDTPVPVPPEKREELLIKLIQDNPPARRPPAGGANRGGGR